MLLVAAALLVLESGNGHRCCQSENCSKRYVVRATVLPRVLVGASCEMVTAPPAVTGMSQLGAFPEVWELDNL